MEEAAVIWKKHGCLEVSAWRLSGSAIGQMYLLLLSTMQVILALALTKWIKMLTFRHGGQNSLVLVTG